MVICSVPDKTTAQAIAYDLVEENLAACVNILPQVTSVYRWQDELQNDEESLLLIKTLKSGFDTLEMRLTQLHPYELPEIIMVPITGGSRAYLDWVAHCVSKSSK